MYKTRELNNSLEVEPFLMSLEASFTQGIEYAGWQNGKRSRRFVIEEGGKTVAYFQAIKFPLIFGKSYYYVPYGPVIKNYSLELLLFLREAVWQIKEKDVVYIRLDFFPVAEDEKILKYLKRYYFKVPKFLAVGSNFQPRQEWVLNIDEPIQSILAGMHKNTRYSIRQAEKKGIKVKIIDKNFTDYFQTFYDLMQETAERNSFSLHPKKYYQNIFLRLDENNINKSFLAVAYLEEKILTIDLIMVFGSKAMYVFSGTDSENKHLGSAYLAQWESIIQAKKLGCSEYNFGGVSIDEKKPIKSWTGFTDYKVKFGGQIINHSDFYDIIYQRFWYLLYALRKLIK